MQKYECKIKLTRISRLSVFFKYYEGKNEFRN